MLECFLFPILYSKNLADAEKYEGYFKEIMEKLIRGEWAVLESIFYESIDLRPFKSSERSLNQKRKFSLISTTLLIKEGVLLI